MSSFTTPPSLLRRLRESPDGEDLRRLHDVYAPFLRGWLVGQGVPATDADGLIREILADLIREIPGPVAEGPPDGEAFRRRLRALAMRRLEGCPRGDRPTAPDDDPALTWDREHDPAIAHRLMSLLEPEFPAATWKAFRRQVLEGARSSEVAAELGLPSNSVLLAKSRVLRRLRQEGQGLIAELD